MIKHKHHPSLSAVLPDQDSAHACLIRRVVKIGCAVNIFLMLLKLSTGWFGHSDALMADGFHSLNDVAADLIMLFFVSISFRKPDAKYSFGYGKFETFSSFLISSVLIVVSILIGVEGVEKIIDFVKGETLSQPDVWTIAVVIFAMICKECLFRFYRSAGRKGECNALLANAWHHRSDAMASIATLIGVSFSYFFGGAFSIFDPIASIVIAIFILVPAIKLLRPAFSELMDHSLSDEDNQKVSQIVAGVQGVEGIEFLHSRRNGHHRVFDIGIFLNPTLPVSRVHEITDEITKRIRAQYCPHVFVTVTVTPL